jgi:protein TonB
MPPATNQRHPAAVHHEHKPWPQRSLTLLAVIGVHLVLGAALLSMQLNAPVMDEPPVLTVHWLPTQRAEQPLPTPKPKEPPPAKQAPAPVTKPVEPPRAKPMEAPLVQAPAAAPAAVEAPKLARAPPAPAPAPIAAAAPQQAAQDVAPPPPIDPNLKPQVDCTQSPEPEYPAASMKLGEEGTVLLRMQVDERGHPLRVEIENSSRYPRLDRAARDTIASSWVCPLRRGKQGFTGWLRVPVKFVLPSL